MDRVVGSVLLARKCVVGRDLNASMKERMMPFPTGSASSFTAAIPCLMTWTETVDTHLQPLLGLLMLGHWQGLKIQTLVEKVIVMSAHLASRVLPSMEDQCFVRFLSRSVVRLRMTLHCSRCLDR